MIDLNARDRSPQSQEPANDPATDRTPDRFLAFMANLFSAFTTVDPRVITQQERRDGRTALGF